MSSRLQPKVSSNPTTRQSGTFLVRSDETARAPLQRALRQPSRVSVIRGRRGYRMKF